jgi:mono/diheme cytochrome c family protein
MKPSMPSLVLFAALLFACAPLSASAQSAATENLDNIQSLGMRLFNQHCRVCHTKPQLSSPQYGPVLSKDSLGGKDGVLREVISNGTPRMPGFKYTFQPAEIDAIVAYIKTMPSPLATPAPAAKRGGNSREAD